MDNEKKRVWGKNFTQRYIEELLDIVSAHSNEIMCKETNKVSLIQKKKAWESVTLEFNSRNVIPRDPNALKIAFTNFKRNKRKRTSEINQENFVKRRRVNEDTALSVVLHKQNEDTIVDLVHSIHRDAVIESRIHKMSDLSDSSYDEEVPPRPLRNTQTSCISATKRSHGSVR